MFTYKVMGGAAFVLSYAVLLFIYPTVDLVGASFISVLIGSLLWMLLWYWATRRNGVCIEFRYSNSRPGLSEMTLWRGLKKLGNVEINMSLDGSGKPQMDNRQIIAQLKYVFEGCKGVLISAQVLHFVGCQKDDADRICRVIVDITVE